MKILITLSTLHGGGAERVAVVWADAFVKLGHEVVLATDKAWEDAPFCYPVNKDVHMAKCFGYSFSSDADRQQRLRKRYGILYRVYRAANYYIHTHRAIRKEIKRFRPDVILGVMNITSLQSYVAALGTGCPVIATEHNSFDRPDDPEAALKRHERFFKFTLNKLYPLVSVLTTADKDFIGSRLKNIVVVPNPLATQPIDSPKLTKQKRIVAAGRLNAWECKGFDLLIEAWSKIAKKYPDWTIDIAGSGDEKAKSFLQSLIDKGGVANQCVLSGFHNDVATYYAESEIFVLSSRYEGFGMVLVEAMSQGCACIAADYKGRQREIMPTDDIGICVPPNNAEALAAAMERVISDENLRRNMQQRAIERAKDYDHIEIGRKWEALVRKVNPKV